jgi:hypothetical protein
MQTRALAQRLCDRSIHHLTASAEEAAPIHERRNHSISACDQSETISVPARRAPRETDVIGAIAEPPEQVVRRARERVKCDAVDDGALSSRACDGTRGGTTTRNIRASIDGVRWMNDTRKRREAC